MREEIHHRFRRGQTAILTKGIRVRMKIRFLKYVLRKTKKKKKSQYRKVYCWHHKRLLLMRRSGMTIYDTMRFARNNRATHILQECIKGTAHGNLELYYNTKKKRKAL